MKQEIPGSGNSGKELAIVQAFLYHHPFLCSLWVALYHQALGGILLKCLLRDFPLFTALLALKQGVGLFIPVPESDACVMIVCHRTVPVPVTIVHNTIGYVPSQELLGFPNGMIQRKTELWPSSLISAKTQCCVCFTSSPVDCFSPCLRLLFPP